MQKLLQKKEEENNKNTSIENRLQKIDKISNNNVNNTSVSAYENNAHIVIGPRNVGKPFYMLKILEKIGNKRPIYIITRSPNQNPSYKTSNEIKPKDKYKGSVVVFDDMLGDRNSSQIDEFFRRGGRENLDVIYISQSSFCLPRQSIKNNSDRVILFKQTLRDVQSIYYDIGANDVNMMNSKKCVINLGVKDLTIFV